MVTVVGAGVDTWAPAWWLDPESNAGQYLDRLATVKVARGAMLPEPIGGHRVMWLRGVGMLSAEGHPTEGALTAPDALPAAMDRLLDALGEADVPVPGGHAADVYFPPTRWGAEHGSMRTPGFVGVRRLDATVDVETSSRAEGLAILAGVASVLRSAATGGKSGLVLGQDGGVETVYLLGTDGRTKLGRWYDKGLESGRAPRGRLIRPEDQRRFTKETRRAVEELDASYVRERFHKRFRTLWRASQGVTVAGLPVCTDKIMDAIDREEVSGTLGLGLIGYLAAHERYGRESIPVSRATGYRYRALLDQLGLCLADGVLQEVEVDLHDVMDAVMDAPGWYGGEG